VLFGFAQILKVGGLTLSQRYAIFLADTAMVHTMFAVVTTHE
jgi:hypothetical protein